MAKLNWTESETFKLIEIWKDFKLRLDSCRNKIQLYLEMAAKLKEEGVDRSGPQIKIRITNLKYLYGQINKTTGSSPIKWVFYQAIHSILHNNHFYNKDKAHTVESGTHNSSTSQVNDLQEVDESSNLGSSENIPPKCDAGEALENDTKENQDSKRLTKGKRKRNDSEEKLQKQGEEMMKMMQTITANSSKMSAQLAADQTAVVTEIKQIGSAFTNFLNTASLQQSVYMPSNYGPSMVYTLQPVSDNGQNK